MKKPTVRLHYLNLVRTRHKRKFKSINHEMILLFYHNIRRIKMALYKSIFVANTFLQVRCVVNQRV